MNLLEALRMLNGRYGKGDVEKYRLYFDGTGIVYLRCTSCKPHTRKFRYQSVSLERGRIFFLGHQATIID